MSEKRLNKFISESGYCSRREADKLIEQSRVTINGQRPELGTKVQPGDSVEVDGKPIKATAADKRDRVYIAYNKPVGITCTTERDVRGNIIDAIGHKQRIFPIGRLDKPSEGLILLTSDGDIVNKILRAENAHDKEYLVTVDKPISERFVERMSRGVPILGTITKPCVVTPAGKFQFKIILTQGLNRQIRRMCEHLGYEVTQLKRSRIMHIDLKGLKSGQWRDLTEQEMVELNAAVAHSTGTADPAKSREVKRNKPKQGERSGNPRRPSGQGEGRGALAQKGNRSHNENSRSDADKRRSGKNDNRGKSFSRNDDSKGKSWNKESERPERKRSEGKPGGASTNKGSNKPSKKVYVNPNAKSAVPKAKPKKSGDNTLSLKRKPK